MSINVNVGANTGPLERDVRAAMDRINRAGGLKVRVDDKGVTQPLGNMKRSADEFTKSLEASNARVLAFGASVGIINAVSNAFKGLVQQTIVVEKNLTDINVVMGLTTQQLDRFGDGLFKVAAETGAGFRVASEAATEFARQGLSVTETLKRTKDALILTRLTGMKAADSVKSLTAAMNTFKGEIKDSTQLVSKFAAVDVKFAVSAEDFAQAIARAGASARDAGVDINELIGIVTAVQERTARGGAVIGNAFKTIFTRIRRSSTLQELENLGIAVRDVQGATLPAMKILQQLAVRYDGLTDAQKSYISQNVAGVFQVNMLKAAMSDLGKANNVTAQATNIASNATDESNRKNEQLRDTMSALATETGVAIQNLAKKIGDIALAPGINKILDGVKGIADFANGILGDGEKEGSRFAKGLLGGIGNFISGPGLVILTAVVSKLFINAAKYGVQSLQSLLGMNKAATARKHTEQAILQVLASNSALSKEMLRTDISREKKEQMILGLIRQQTVEAQKLAAVSKQLTMPLVRAGVTPNLSLRRADGFIPNFAIDKTERQLAAEGGYAAGAIKDIRIPGVGNVTYNTAEDVKKFPGMTQPAIVPPQGSKAGDNYDLAFQKAHGFSPYASGGFVPNFAAKLPTTHIRDLNKYASDHGFKGSGLYSTAKQNRFGPGGTKDSSFRGGAIYLDANKLLGEPFMNTMGVMVGQGQNTLQKKNYTAAITSIPALRPLVAQLNKNHKGAAANTRVRVGIKEKGLYPVDGGDISSVSKNMRGGFTSTLKTTPGLSSAMDNLADKVREKIGLPAGEVKIGKGSALSHVLGEASWRGYMLEAGVKSALGRGIDTGKESQRAFDLEGNISQGLRDFMGMPLLRALELKATDEAAKSGGVPNKVFNRIFNDYATGTRLRTEFEKRIGMASGAKAASGYVPNFADPLSAAIGRERNAGVPVSKIRVGSHKALKARSNPMGIGVTNTSDEPNGLKDIFGADGYVPNYAAPLVKNLGIAGGGIVDKKQSKLLHKSIAKIHREFEMGAIDIKEVRMKLENLGTSTKGVDDSLKLGKGTIDRLQNKIKSTTTSMGQFKAGLTGQGTGLMGGLGRFQSGEGTGKAAFLGRQATGMGGMGAMMGLSMGAAFVRGDDPTSKSGQSLGGAMEGASTGMSMGMMFGPIGMALGAVAGGILGFKSGLDKATKAAEELAEKNKAAATSVTTAAMSFALQNEQVNKTFNADLGSFDINTMQRGKQFAIKAARPDSDRRHNQSVLADRQKAYDDFQNANKGQEIYLSKEGGYTTDINEAKTRQGKGVYGTSTMSFQDAVNSFGANLGPKANMGEYLNALAGLEPKSLEDISSTLGLSYSPARKGYQRRGSGDIIGAREELVDQEAIEAQAKDKKSIVDLRKKFMSSLIDTELEKTKTFTYEKDGKQITTTGQELVDKIGKMNTDDAFEMTTQIFQQLNEEGKKAAEAQAVATAQFIAKLNFEKAQLVSQKSFSDRMHAMNMQTLKTNGSIDANLKLYSNSIAASTRSRLLHNKKENEIENKLQQERLKASQSYKDSIIGFLNNDGGTGIGQQLKNAINDPDSMTNISAVLGEDIAKQFEKAKGQAGEMEKVLASLTNEQLTKLLSNLNEQVLSNSKITDFLDIQKDKLKNQNSLADNNAAIAREKLSIEEKTNAILDARAEKLKNINLEMERIRNASKFMSEAAGLIVSNADLDSQISLARMGGGTQRQQFAASQASAQRKFIAQKMGREDRQRDQLMGSILQNSTFRTAGLLDSPDLSAEKLTKMTPEQLIKQVKSSAAARSTVLNEQLNQARSDMQYVRDPTIPYPDQADEIKKGEDIIRTLETQINLQQQASQESDKMLNNIEQQLKQNEALEGLYDKQYQKMKQLAQVQHEFVYGDNAFANGMNKAFADAQDRADRFKYDLGEALPQSFSRNMSQALSDIVTNGDFEEGMLNAGINFFKELNQMFTQNIMDQMMGAMLGDGAKSEQQQQIETTRQLKNTIEGTLSRSIDRLSTSVDSLASSVQTMPAKEASKPEGSGLGSLIADFFKYQGGPIRMNTGGQVPAMLTSGEFVMNKRAVSKLGKANMDLLNQGYIPRFGEGGAAFAAALGAGATSMATNWLEGKLAKKEAKKSKKWERGKDAFEQNRAYKRNRMSAFYMQNSSAVQEETNEIRMQKEQALQRWIDKQNKKQQLGRQIVSVIGNAALAGLGASLSSSTGIGSSVVKDSQGNVVRNAQGIAKRQSFFTKADNTLGYKSFFANTSQTMANYNFNRAGGSDALRQASMQRKSANSDRMNQGMNNHVQAFYEQNYQNAVKSYAPVHKANQLSGAPHSGFNSRKEYEQSNRFFNSMFYSGGKVTGPSGIDRVPAMLTEGEYVINARAARKIGMPALESINAGKYNEGGLVKDSTAKPGQPGDSKGMTNNISINVTVNGSSTSENSEKSSNDPSDQRAQMDDLSKKIKQQVVTVIREENRPGGLLGK